MEEYIRLSFIQRGRRVEHNRTVVAILIATFASCLLFLASVQTEAAIDATAKATTEAATDATAKATTEATAKATAKKATTDALLRQANSGSAAVESQTSGSVSNNQVGQAATGVPQQVNKKRDILGFTTADYPSDTESYNSVQAYGANMSSIATFAYLIEGNGNLNGETPTSTLKAAKAKGAQALVLIHNFKDGFDPKLAHELLSNPSSRQKLIANLLTIMKRAGYSGVNLDIEGIYAGDRSFYSQFLLELRNALKPQGYLLTVSIPPKTWDDPKDGWAGGYDYEIIGKLADKVLLMTYDENWSGGPAGPVASLSWVNKVIEYSVKVLPKEKILLGIAAYGYDWSSQGTKTLQYADATELARENGAQPQWSGSYQVPHFSYRSGGIKHEVWYENEPSLRAKLKVVKNYDLGGIGIWRLGYEDTKLWQIVNEELK